MGQTTAEALSVDIGNITDESGFVRVSLDDFDKASPSEKNAMVDAWIAEVGEKREEEEFLSHETPIIDVVRGIGAAAIVIEDEALDQDWQRSALCSQTDPESFFPEKGGSTRNAKKVCTNCTVRKECLHYAMSTDQRFGIWGGLSERERHQLKKAAV